MESNIYVDTHEWIGMIIRRNLKIDTETGFHSICHDMGLVYKHSHDAGYAFQVNDIKKFQQHVLKHGLIYSTTLPETW